MSKRFMTVDDVLKKLGRNTALRSGIVISLFSFSDLTIYAFSDLQYSSQSHIELVSSMEESRPIMEMTINNSTDVEFYLGSTLCVTEMLDEVFEELKVREPQAATMEDIFYLIRDGIGNIFAEKVSVNCDVHNNVLNVAYRLPGDMLLSVSKPSSTADDQFVMFNLFHLRKLLISDTADLSLLSRYIHNAELKAAQLA